MFLEQVMERTIKPSDFLTLSDSVVLDVRRTEDYSNSSETISGSSWKDPAIIDQWIESVPRDRDVVIYCVRGGGVSNSVLDQLLASGVQARYIEGGIEAIKEVGGAIESK